MQNGIGTLIQWGGKAIHHFEVLGFDLTLPKTDKFFERCIMLPINMFITDGDIDYICEKIHNFYERV
jgi:dTDP-4-amino-4,6-dideoxygalactose transaminase